jgi:hypothetical protein
MKLKILCSNPPGGAFHHITEAWGRTFKQCGHSFKKWDESIKTWEEYEPDLYLGCSGHRQPIPKKRSCVIGIHCNPFCRNKLDKVHGTDINESKSAITWVVKQEPDFVFGYGIQSQEPLWASYRKLHGIPWYGVATAGDATHYYPDAVAKYRCDVAYIGGRWTYKSHNIDKYLLPVLRNRKIKSKLFGWGGWEGVGLKYSKLPGQNRSEDNTEFDRKILSSCKVGPAIAEPHTTIYNIDWPERIFKVPLCGAMTISDPISKFNLYLDPDIFPMAKNPREYAKLVVHYIRYDEEREKMIEKQREYILSYHTYFERIKIFLKAGGFQSEFYDVDGIKNDLLERLCA